MKLRNDKYQEIERLHLELEARLELIRSQVAVHAKRFIGKYFSTLIVNILNISLLIFLYLSDWNRVVQPTQSWNAPKSNQNINVSGTNGFLNFFLNHT
jgi:hypothetical protein